MFDRSIYAEKLSLDPQRRIIAISDIHGNLQLLQRLLTKVSFDADSDELFLVGDLLEKGTQNLATLHYLMDAAKSTHIHPMIGNCDIVCKNILYEYRLDFLKELLLVRRNSILHEMAAQLGIQIQADSDMHALSVQLKQAFTKELEFIVSLPHVIETPSYIFAHAAIQNETTYGQDMRDIMTHDLFQKSDVHFHKYVVVGHTPVSEYHDSVCDFTPLIDTRKHIISIDGGNGVKQAGQLNALIIEKDTLSYFHSDDLPKVSITADYQPTQTTSVFITWHDRTVIPLQEETQSVYCLQPATNRKLWIPKIFLQREQQSYSAENYTDYQHTVQQGEQVKLVSVHGTHALIKKHGKMGWIPKKIIAQLP